MEEALKDIDIDLYNEMTAQRITNYDLPALSKLLAQYAEELDELDTDLANLFTTYSQEVARIHRTLGAGIARGMGELAKMVSSVESYDSAMNLSLFVPEIKAAQEDVDSDDVTRGVNATFREMTEAIVELAEDVENAVRNHLAPCYSVYGAIDQSIQSVCVSFLNPYNAFWFSMGSCLFLFTLSVPVVLCLVTLFRRMVLHIDAPNLHRLHRQNGMRAPHATAIPHPAPAPRKNHRKKKNHHHHHHHQRAAAPSYNHSRQGESNNGFVPDTRAGNNHRHHNAGVVDYQILRDHPIRGQPIRPTQNYVLDLRTPSTRQQRRTSSSTDPTDYF